MKKVWQLYTHGKQTYKQIAQKYNRSIKWVQKIIDYYIPPYQHVEPCRTPLVIDAMFFNRKSGILVFRSPTIKKNVFWKTIETEKVMDYIYGILELISWEFEITGIVVDGRRGVIKGIERLGIPVQMCQFHQIQIVTRYITRDPRLPASKELKKIVLELPHTDKVSFEYWLNKWHKKWNYFLEEKTYDPFDQNKWHYTHERLRKAYRSLMKHLPNLFTCLDYPDLPNTTNSLDGSFSHLRDKLRLHRGLKYNRKIKLVYELLS